ncbi:YbaB/EbfC family nucleoid-associated protein [Amycolatopsis sp. FBCC-B4732]|uniref:YbaB/EbfC family nucleoid-associated protein n=1 Tax=Amycolatopsis sp. FBCC-B4732 TaxID=3079339 RepID=UPI001FF25D62|nr:YbaB/EbfC family nucleoid-associated protein [Amycolatopsis sp. FBCC-B4732]UOX88515.1 YbaB/EbfC family nucleoid-associated protein [Amycolatopsis sp. FBCC-B4732]
MPDSIDASDAMIDNWTKRLEENAARYQALADRVQGQSVTERSKDGTVQVTVDSRGLLKNLVIAETASGKRMAEVSAQVMQLVQRAQARIPELLQQAMTETTGTGDQAAAEIVREAQSTFPQPPPEPEPAFPEPDRVRRFLPEDNEEQQPPRTPPPPAAPPAPPQPPRRRRPVDNDDDDDFGGPILS